MSDEARTFVKLYSPFSNGTWWFHYVLADKANHDHNYELFWRVDAMLNEWPALTRHIVSEGRQALLDGGYLKQLEAPAPGRPGRYRFIFKDHEDLAIRLDGTGKRHRSVPESGTVPSRDYSLLTEIRTERSRALSPRLELEDAEFSLFWKLYPHRVAKPEARKAYAGAAKSLAPGSTDPLFIGFENWLNYWRDAHTELRFIPYPSSWLNQKRWKDEPPPVALFRPRRQSLDDLADNAFAQLRRDYAGS